MLKKLYLAQTALGFGHSFIGAKLPTGGLG
jgi:hypothetical protein